MKVPSTSIIEHLPEFTWVHFEEQKIVDMETLESIISQSHLLDDSQRPILLDISAIDGFYVDAFEMLITALTTSRHPIALLAHINSISEKYMTLLEMSVENTCTKSFNDLTEAKKWLIH